MWALLCSACTWSSGGLLTDHKSGWGSVLDGKQGFWVSQAPCVGTGVPPLSATAGLRSFPATLRFSVFLSAPFAPWHSMLRAAVFSLLYRQSVNLGHGKEAWECRLEGRWWLRLVVLTRQSLAGSL